VLVRDMWLTGLDAPSLRAMYVDKPTSLDWRHAECWMFVSKPAPKHDQNRVVR